MNWPHTVPASVVTNARFSLTTGVGNPMGGNAVSTVSVRVVVVSSNVTVSVMIVSGALEDTLGWTAEEGVTVWRMERGRTGTVSVSVRVTPSIVSVKVFVTSRTGRAAA